MNDMPTQGSRYTDEQRREAAIQYAIKGNLRHISKAMDIPRTTLRDWRKQEWFDTILAEVRHENADKHIALYSELTEKALTKASKAVDKLKINELSPNDIKALVVTGATSTDKARLLMNQPTSISGKAEGMSELMAKFEKIERDHQNIKNSVVSEQ